MNIHLGKSSEEENVLFNDQEQKMPRFAAAASRNVENKVK